MLIMNENIRVLMPTEIPNIYNIIDFDCVTERQNRYVKDLSNKINLEDLGDWKLLISINSRATNGIGFSKRVLRYPSDQEFEISLSICIPDEDHASYGLAEVKESFYHSLNDKNFYILEPFFENYKSLFDYILESSKRAINLAFTYGFTCNGKKIKFQ